MNSSFLIDTHTHIYYEEGSALDKLINRCLSNNIQKLILPNVDINSIQKVKSAVDRYPSVCIPMMGLHPCSVKEDYMQQLDQIEKMLSDMEICAIGEIGIDLHWGQSTLEWQQEAFERQIYWALEREIPINIHCRNAFEETFEIVENIQAVHPQLKGVFHCFTGDKVQAKRALDVGFKLGIGGIVTFKNAGLDKTISSLDLEHIVLETDSPYLAPAPFRGKQNESSYLIHIAQKIADLHQVDINIVADITTQNAIDIFKLKF